MPQGTASPRRRRRCHTVCSRNDWPVRTTRSWLIEAGGGQERSSTRYEHSTHQGIMHNAAETWFDHLFFFSIPYNTWYGTRYLVLLYQVGIYLCLLVPGVHVFAIHTYVSPFLNSDPGSHSKLFSPSTHNGSCLAFFSREDFSSFFDSRRIVPTLFLFLFLQIYSKSRHGGIRTHGPTLVAFEGYN